MTIDNVQDITPREQYIASAAQTVYPYPFPIFENSDMAVAVNGATITGFTVTGAGNDTGGNVILTTPSTVGDIVTVYRAIPIARSTEYQQNGPFTSAALNTELDRIIAIAQQLAASLAQSLQVPVTNNGATTLLTPAAYSGKYLSFDANGNPQPAALTSSGSVTAGLIAGFVSPTTAAETAAGITPPSPIFSTLPYADVRRYGVVGDGSTDDTAALQKAFSVAATYGLALVIPYGLKVKTTSYVNVFSNTTLHLLGKLIVNNRAAGLSIAGQSNVSIYGHKMGLVQDPVVLSAYGFNTFTVLHPSIHVRANNAGTVPSSNVLIDGVNFAYVQQGVFLSSSTVDSANAASWPVTTAQANNCVVQNCNMQFCEASGVAALSVTDCCYRANYVYRCGDGGMWMMGAINSDVIGNHRVSPTATPAAVNFGAGPFNVLATPATWNDEQGMQFQSCYNLLIQGNVVENFWSEAIDIKDSCQRVLCTGNRVNNCENASIVCRSGDPGNQAANLKITIIGNIISGHGTLQFNNATPQQGAICIANTYIAEVINNVIYSYQNTPGINCLGPEPYQTNQFSGGNPHQSAITIQGNTFDFRSNFQENDANDTPFMGNAPAWTGTTAFTVGQTVKPTAGNTYYYVCAVAGTTASSQPTWSTTINGTTTDGGVTWITQTTLSAININGQYDSVSCDHNHIRTDRYNANDARFNGSAAINLQYVSALGTFYPSSATINNNVISGWGNIGVTVTGLGSTAPNSGLIVNANAISQSAGIGINLSFTNKAVVCNNSISQPGAPGAVVGIALTGASGNPIDGVVCSNNAITGNYNAASNMNFAFYTSFASNIIAQGNTMAGWSSGQFSINSPQGPHNFTGTTGFPRTGGATPNAAVSSFWQGEDYFDSVGLAWWKASAANSTVWTKITN